MVTTGRREQHKAATRQALQDAARRLFEERGYASTTVRDIASAAGVTERTFFRYFRSKEDLVLGEVLDLIPALQEAVLARPREEDPYTAVLHALLALAAEREGGFGVLFSGPPGRFLSRLTRPAQPVLLEFEDALADALARRPATPRTTADVTALRASVQARAAVAAMRSTIIAFAALPPPDQTLDSALRLINQAFAALRP